MRLCLALLLLASSASADDRIITSFGPSLNGGTNPKYLALGYEKAFDHLSVIGQCSGIFASPAIAACSLVLSVRVETLDGIFARIGVGPGLISRTDDRLSSRGEVNIRYALGIDQGGWEVGLEGTHWSNAGWVPPNLGRDFAGFYLGF